MKQEEKLFLQILNAALHPEDTALYRSFDTSILQVMQTKIFSLARIHKILPPVYEFYCRQEIPVENAALHSELSTYVLSCHQMTHFTEYITRLLQDAGIPFFLLKGTNLSKLYPKTEFRRFGDVDILINDDILFEQAKQLFLAKGFRAQDLFADHHIEFFFHRPERVYILELHRKVITSQNSKKLDAALISLYDALPLTEPLSPTMEALYLLLHMLQHLLNSGFGVKLLCDWVVYLEHTAHQIDSAQLASLLKELGLFDFSAAVTQLCVEHLGLSNVPDCFCQPLPNAAQKTALLAEDIFSGGEFGKADASRMLILKKGSGLPHYLKEFHFQMKRRYPTLQYVIPLWPLLWLFTGCYFVYNNRHLRHTSTQDILQTARERHQLLKTLHIRL